MIYINHVRDVPALVIGAIGVKVNQHAHGVHFRRDAHGTQRGDIGGFVKVGIRDIQLLHGGCPFLALSDNNSIAQSPTIVKYFLENFRKKISSKPLDKLSSSVL